MISHISTIDEPINVTNPPTSPGTLPCYGRDQPTSKIKPDSCDKMKCQFLERVVTGRGSTILGRQLKLAEPTTIPSLGETSFEYESDSGPENIVPDVGRLAWSRTGCGSAAIGIRAGESRSTCFGQRASCPRAPGCPIKACRPIADGAELAESRRRIAVDVMNCVDSFLHVRLDLYFDRVEIGLQLLEGRHTYYS